jgi:hypothetical protein
MTKSAKWKHLVRQCINSACIFNVTVTLQFGPSEEDGSGVSEWEVHNGRQPMSKRTSDSGFVEVINKGDKPGRCDSRRKEMQITLTPWFQVLHSKSSGVPLETRWCIGAVPYIYLVLNYLITEVTVFCVKCSIYRCKLMYSYSCTCTT